MRYTVRFAHLKKQSPLAVGTKVTRGMRLGEIGNTGQSTSRHLHIDNIEDWIDVHYTLATMEIGGVSPSPRQLNYFIDEELFGGNPFHITAHYCDPKYQYERKKLHYGYDIVLDDVGAWELFWNRTPLGVILVNRNHKYYGNHLCIGYEV
ncbi:MAG: hypothetical protein DRN81_03150 [Thermoproteota archaeon]|nr:MAG: hypothetical protein DRN81_03150 [Candidatus Korarchaeota archaeon]